MQTLLNDIAENKKIFLVEDDRATALHIKSMLLKWEYLHVDVFSSGEDIIEHLTENNGDLIIMDITLDGALTGIEAGEIILQSQTIPIVYITASSNEELIDKAASCGAYGFIHKPINPQFLKNTIQIALSKYQAEIDLLQYKDNLEEIVTRRTKKINEVNHKLYLEIEGHKETEKQLKLHRDELEESHKQILAEMHNARKVQEALLPRQKPEYNNCTIDFTYMPMIEVGGDYLSFTSFAEKDQLGIFIGDVSGHGVSAALYTFLVKAITDNLYFHYGLNPDIFIKKLNNELTDSMESHFMTGQYILLSKVNNDSITISMCGAGHPSPIIYCSNDNSISTKMLPGPALGWNIKAHYNQIKITLNKGDKIFFYTDGTSEIRNTEGIILGEDNLMKIVYNECQKQQSISDDLKNTVAQVLSYSKSNSLQDDLLIIAIEV